MSMTIKGTIHQIFETKEIGQKGFKKREFVVSTDEKYPQLLMLEATNDRTSSLDKYHPGDAVTVSFNLKGRKWDGPNGTRFFNTIEAWRIEGEQKAATEPAPETPDVIAQDDIPF